ncbi:hypothetical protein BJ878DRAFT_520665 [Calycina marina]|uniref:DUF3824 domain-containing protein n=1 Tax=Calycina marina TaxID=1763456 RepID=A0A9P7YWV1_9HELO|nr:hypothetical protein BJ878DRAFT_520665 [Calycina marina]
MSQYDYDDRPRQHRSHHHRDDRDDREPRYFETQETYVRKGAKAAPPLAPDAPYTSTRTEIIRRPAREDSDLSVEEVRRDFPPPGSAYDDRTMARRDRYGPPARARSADRSDYAYDRRSRRDDDRPRRSAQYLDEKYEEPRRRSLSRNQKIIAAVGGAALAVGGKELWDRKKADGRPVSRNALATAAVGAAGAVAGYEATEVYSKYQEKNSHVKKKTYAAHEGRNGDVADYYSEDEVPKKSRRKSIVEGALGLAGLGAAANAVGGGDKERGRNGSPDSHRSSRSKSRHGGRAQTPEGTAKFQQAAKAALLAGATEAFRVRKEPGGWAGAKGKRILTAAIGAGGIDAAAADRNTDNHSKRHILEAVVGGLAGNRLINGSRNNVADDDRRSRSRSRARSRSRGGDGGVGTGAGLAALATAGLGALSAKKIYDRSRSRDPADRRRGSPDSYDSRSPSPRHDKHKRSKSVSDYARKGLASLGIGAGASAADYDYDRGKTREIEDTRSKRSGRRSPRYSSDEDDRPRYSKGRGDVYGDPRYADSRSSNVGSRRGEERERGDYRDTRSRRAKKEGASDRRVAEGKQFGSDSDSLGSSSGDEKRIKKMKASRHRDR